MTALSTYHDSGASTLTACCDNMSGLDLAGPDGERYCLACDRRLADEQVRVIACAHESTTSEACLGCGVALCRADKWSGRCTRPATADGAGLWCDTHRRQDWRQGSPR